MASDSDTLNLGNLRAGKRHPQADVQSPGGLHSHRPPAPAYNPSAAAEARARIASLPQHHTIPHPDAIPTAATAGLITDRQQLRQGGYQPTVAKKRKLPSAVGPILTAVLP